MKPLQPVHFQSCASCSKRAIAHNPLVSDARISNFFSRTHHWSSGRTQRKRLTLPRREISQSIAYTPCFNPRYTTLESLRSRDIRVSPHLIPAYTSVSTRSFSCHPVLGKDNAEVSSNGNAFSLKKKTMKYFIALGSNMGDRFGWIEKACRELETIGIRIIATSGLWQTKAMYVQDQDDFLNGVCVVETSREPIELMKALQGIENKLGRVKVIDKGPRNIDLDILLWEGGAFQSDSPDLMIPHKLMEERDFVLAPLTQLLPLSPTTELPDDQMPNAFIRNRDGQPYRRIWDRLRLCPSRNPDFIQTRTKLNESLPPLVPSLNEKSTHVMSILNLTPDSFSDGGRHAWNNEDYLRSTISAHLKSGATIIDLGGQSSRPGAVDISAEEEIARIMPALNILSSMRQDPNTLPFAISIDTYRASVADAAVAAGADIINDISAGALDSDMLATVARLGCTYVLMHMRGTPHTMTSKENTTYKRDLISTVRDELIERLTAAELAGVRRWRMILDPGIGFAKTASQNLEILRNLDALTLSTNGRVIKGAYRSLEGMPWLVGSSRKSFVGKITNVKEASHRVWGTAATVAAAVQGGADIVRVHDVDEMKQVVRMSDAIWRGWNGTTAETT